MSDKYSAPNPNLFNDQVFNPNPNPEKGKRKQKRPTKNARKKFTNQFTANGKLTAKPEHRPFTAQNLDSTE